MNLIEAKNLLDESYEALSALVRELSVEKWTLRRAEGNWTPAEICEHVARVEAVSLIGLKRSEPAGEAVSRDKDERLVKLVPERSFRVEAPDAVRPKGRFATPAEFLEEFQTVRGRTLEWASAAEEELRARTLRHPAIGMLDGVQWLLFFAGHTTRHRLQIEELFGAPATSVSR